MGRVRNVVCGSALLALGACDGDPGDGGSVAPPVQPPGEEAPAWVTLEDLPAVLASADDVAIHEVEVVGDLDADGFADAAVYWSEGDVGGFAGFVRGPLTQAHTVPDDVWFSYGRDPSYAAAELTGDGQLDLHVVHGDDVYVIPGPVTAPPVLLDGWVPLAAGWHEDLDRDGILDLFRSTGDPWAGEHEQFEITWGPIDRWSGPPDVVVGPPCDGEPAGYAYSESGFSGPFTFGDLDGDGLAELSFGSWGWADGDADCGAFTLSLPASGVIDPYASVYAVPGLTLSGEVALDDRTGDGLPEVLRARDRVVVASPVVLEPSGVTGASTVPLADAVRAVYPREDAAPLAAFEVNDGLVRWVLAPLGEGLDALTAPNPKAGWQLARVPHQVPTWTEDGVAYALIDHFGTWRLVTLP